jgi:ubiquinone/menaquinone biosynthesis C-methylase UbiE
MQTKWLMLIAVVLMGTTFAGVVAWRFAIFCAPYAWTGEPALLRDLLAVKEGARVADIGAGDGALAIEMARVVGANGLVYASDISAERRQDIAARARRERIAQVRVVEGLVDATNLPEACCDAIYMRAVFHHIQDRRAFARSIAAGVRPGGRVAIIDFPPGGLWFHGSDHGVTTDAAMAAFREAGLTLTRRIDDWGGGMFLLLFELRTQNAELRTNAVDRLIK